MNGYITTTRKKHYVLLTEKKYVNAYVVAEFLCKIAEVEGIAPEKLTAALTDRHTITAMRKKIEHCQVEKKTSDWGEYYNVVAGKTSPTFIGNFYMNDESIVVFTETRKSLKANDVFEEV